MKQFKSSMLLTLATFFLLSVLFTKAYSQVQTAKYGVAMTGNSGGFYEYLPQGYGSGSETYPLIIFIHGVGELGSGENGQLQKLLVTGLAASINVGELPVSFNVNGQTHKFIAISPQFRNWPSPQDINDIIDYALRNYRVNTSRIYLTGFSMGGGVVWDYVGNNAGYANRIAAIVPIAGASWPDNGRARTIANANVAVWALHNSGDPTVPVWYTDSYIDQINAAPSPNPQAKKTIFSSGSHDAWTFTYNSTNKDESGRTIYQWMLQYQKGFQAPPSSNQLPVANAGTDKNISTFSIQLSGSGSDPDGTISSYSWSTVSAPNLPVFSNPNIANPTLSGLIGGNYVFRLRVTDNQGSSHYDDVSITVTSPVPGRIEAEGYSAMNGIQTENTTDAGSGQNVGWQDNNDWMDYMINVTTSRTYTVKFRVSTINTGVQFQLRKANGTVLTTVTVPNTGGWQSWQTVSALVPLSAGQQTIRIYSTDTRGGWNINWMEFSASAPLPNQPPIVNAGNDQQVTLPVSSVNLSGNATDPDGSISSYAWSTVSGPAGSSFANAAASSTVLNGLIQGTYVFRLTVTDNASAAASDEITVTVNAAAPVPPTGPSLKIQAESYTSMSGIQTENTADEGGGLNVGWQETSDWMDYSVNLAAAGTYTVNFRVATINTGALFQLKNSSGTVLQTITVPNTGGWQTFQTVSATVSLPAGQQTLRIYTSGPQGLGWNINWWEIMDGYTPPPPPPPPVPPTSSLKIQAESYTSMSGIQTENTADEGGGLNVGWQETSDWMDYSVNLAAAGTYTVNFRVATINTGALFQLKNSSGTVLQTITVPNTGGWQTFQTVSATVSLPAGQQTLRIYTSGPQGLGWNINWWEIMDGYTPPPPPPPPVPPTSSLKIQAESYTSMSGIQTENTADEGGGLNVGWQETSDWMDYSVNLAAAGTYTVNFRVATINTGALFQLKNSSGTVLQTITVPNTGGWQTFQTVSATVSLPAGQQTLRIYTSGPQGLGWNINWWEIMDGYTTGTSEKTREINEISSTSKNGFEIYPNPVQDRFILQFSNELAGPMKVQLFNMSGAVVKQFSLSKPNRGASQTYLSVGELPSGQYILNVTIGQWSESKNSVNSK